ncbi:RNA-directed DNA polymerase, eukaryota, reverse transcriptase zinc-binding domain protein [Tanacetum coccineum]
MDEKIAQMCQFGMGRTDFPRVLIEIEANKDLQEVIKIEYIGENKDVKGTKRKENVGEGNKNGDIIRNMEKGESSKSGSQNQRSASPKTQNKEQNVNKNKFSVLDEENINKSNEMRILKDRKVVDQFLNKRMQPTCKEASYLTKDMVKYFHNQWEINRLKENEDQGENVEDVYENEGGIAQAMTADNVIGTERKELWKDIMRTKSITAGWPWMMVGDFNVTLKVDEHFSGGSRVSNDMHDFIDCVNELDRVMVNEEFCLKFPTANALFLPYMVSDHIPIVVSFHLCFEKKRISFKFTNFIVEKEEFIPIVDSRWKTDIHGCKMFKLVKKMKSIKSKLKDLSWKNGNLHELVENCRQKLKVAQVKLDKNPDDKDAKKDEIKDLIKYNEVVHDEESLLLQKAKVEWISKGGRNNLYFHKVIKSRNQEYRITCICDEQGKILEGRQMQEQFVNHFKKFFEANKNIKEMDDFEGVFGKRLNEEEALSMVREITDSEIKNAMFSIGDTKAPGPDGFTSTFFKKAWGIVGSDVCLAIKEFFQTGKLLGEMNATLISLIPKISTPNKVTDYRPIACCNVVYKCISKIITERIKPGLQKLELLKGYDRKNRPSRYCFKIDITKAYDTVDWKFLKKCLINFGFHKNMVKWIMVCVTTAKFSININGERKGYFSSGRGLRQGDPMSPCLFTLVMEIFTLLMMKNVKGNSNVKDDDKIKILDILPFTVGKLLMKYLGVPLITKKIVTKECKQLIGKVKKRKAKVKWESVCTLKSQGSLRIRMFGKWNEILLMKNLWNIAEEKNTLWVKWVKMVKLRGESIWEVQKGANDSWMLKCLLELRSKIRKHTFKVMGDGKNTKFWVDEWNSKGIISKIINWKDIYDARLSGEESVWDMVEGYKWSWPKDWTLKYPILKGFKMSSLKYNDHDKTKWKDRNGNLTNFHSKAVWEAIYPHGNVVNWSKLTGMKVKSSTNVQKIAADWNINMNNKVNDLGELSMLSGLESDERCSFLVHSMLSYRRIGWIYIGVSVSCLVMPFCLWLVSVSEDVATTGLGHNLEGNVAR